MEKKYNSKHHLKQEFSFILKKLHIIRLNYELFKSLTSNEEKKYITDNIPYTSEIILEALFNNIILELSKITVDSPEYKGLENINIKNFLKKYNENKELFKVKKYYYATEINTNKKHRIKLENNSCEEIIKKYKEIEKNNKHLIEYLKTRRNKTIAHNDEKFCFDSKNKYSKKVPTYQQLENFINDIYDIINELNKSIFGITTVSTYYFKTELDWLKELIKNNEKRHRN